MIKFLRFALFFVLAVMINSKLAQAEPPSGAKFDPTLIVLNTKPIQPFGGEIRFVGKPALAKTCSLKVMLTSYRAITTDYKFRVVKAEVYDMPISPDTMVWAAPTDSGKTRVFNFTFKPAEVGTHHFTLELKQDRLWQPLAQLRIDIDEDGRTICAGPEETCKNTAVPPHTLHTKVPLVVNYPINELISDRYRDRHFSAVFKITPGKSLSDSVMVDFDLQCHVGLYSAVQFIVEYTNGIILSPLPASWGDNAGPAEGYQFYHGHFSFLTLKPGLAQLIFRVSGKHPMARKATRINTEFSIYLAIGDTGEILFAGNFDPFTRFKDAGDPMLGSLQSLLAVTNRDFRMRHVLSLPDYFGQEIGLPDEEDSTGTNDSQK